MTDPDKERKSDRIVQILLEGTRIDKALREAVRQALWRHKQLGQSIVVWRDGQVTWIAPEDIQVPSEHAEPHTP